MPPRAVSRTATSMSRRREDLVRAAGTGPVAGFDHPLVDEHAVGRRGPDVAAGPHQDVGDQPGDGALAVGPGDRDDRDPAVGVADPRRRRGPRLGDALRPAREHPFLRAGQLGGPRRRDIALGEGERRLGEGLGALGALPREGHDPVAGVRGAMDDARRREPSPWSARRRRIQADERGDRVGPVAGRHPRAEPDERMSPGVPLAVPRPTAADGDLELDHRLEPVDVRAFEQAGLDQSHGPGRIASRLAAVDSRAMDAPTVTPHAPADDSMPCDGDRAPTCRPSWPTSRRLVNIDCGSYTRDGVDEVGALDRRVPRELGATVETRPDPAGRLGDTIVGDVRGSSRRHRSVLLIGHMDTVFDPGTAAERPFSIGDGIAHGPGVTDMKSGLLTGLYAIKALRRRARRAAVRTARLRRQPGRGDRVADLDAPHPRAAPRTSTPPRARVRPGERRHRLVAQGHPRPAASPSTAAPPTPASSPRRAAARSWRPPGSSRAPRPQRALAGRDGQRRGHRRRDAAERRAPSAARSRSTSGRSTRDALEAAEADDPRASPTRPWCPT